MFPKLLLVFWMFTSCDAKATEPEGGTQTLQGLLISSSFTNVWSRETSGGCMCVQIRYFLLKPEEENSRHHR